MTFPNQLTILRIILTPIFVLLLFVDGLTATFCSFIIFTLASLTDWYDGYTARKYGSVSEWGKFLDPLADKILISSAFICFSIIGYVVAWMVLVIVIRDLLITLIRSYSLLKESQIVTNLLAKIKTFGQFVVLFFIFIFHILNKGEWQKGIESLIEFVNSSNIILILMYIITFLTIVSGLIYLIENRESIKQIGIDIYRKFVPSDV